MILNTRQGLKVLRRLDYNTDQQFYRACILIKFGIVLPCDPTFGQKIITC